jgi:hypothetical protein
MASSMPDPNKVPGQGGSDSGDSGAGTATPIDLSQEQQQAAAVGSYEATAAAVPTQVPPSVSAVAAGVTGATAWQNAKKISALWVINQVRNSWAFVAGVGWKKCANNSDSAIVALTALGAHAKLLLSNVDYRDEADGMIHEMYVW